jgi:hypothetical protein
VSLKLRCVEGLLIKVDETKIQSEGIVPGSIALLHTWLRCRAAAAGMGMDFYSGTSVDLICR